jgi:adenylate cyclase class 2
MNQEIECRFLEINKNDLLQKLRGLGARDKGEVLLKETIIYDKELKWRDEHQFIRLRKSGDTTTITFKHHQKNTVDGAYEIEFGVDNYEKAEMLFEKIGLFSFRHQEKKRHTLALDGVTFDIDTWPNIPTYIELEGRSEEALRNAAQRAGLDWNNADFHSASWVIENKYNIPVRQLRWFTFEKIE